MRIGEIGEFGLIERIAAIVNQAQDSKAASWQKLLVGIGDDCAAWYGDASVQLAKVDSLVEGVHFRFDIVSWEDLGWKALAINLSDIASKGGAPRYALVSLALPPETNVEDVVFFYRGMLQLARKSGVAIVGGNMSRAPMVFIDVIVMGSIPSQELMITRSAARPGDLIAVTGYLGSSAAGLEMLTKNRQFEAQTDTYLRNAFARPVPRLDEGRLLTASGVKAGMDISDGLAADLGHICQASRTGARVRIDSLPVHPGVKTNFPDKYLEMALSGGEDYELLFTASADVIDEIKRSSTIPITVIGEIIDDVKFEVTLIDEKGKRFNLCKKGWDHFSTGV